MYTLETQPVTMLRPRRMAQDDGRFAVGAVGRARSASPLALYTRRLPDAQFPFDLNQFSSRSPPQEERRQRQNPNLAV